jgi:Protein of unknown function (DUF721).
MIRKNSQKLGDVLGDFFQGNPELYEKVLEIRIKRAWGAVLGNAVLRYTNNIYVKNKVMYVSLSSSVLRNELTLCREKLIISLNEYAKAEVIKNLVIR